ncbi:MAG: hypothetical protein IGS50_12960 [Synechococcales cyanobacterium C42_A2020_086]|nr:hypothetical protein [Synechococcales cyanobacterium M58_A2018_015]MBF2074656.1 hypothetical protein [Synechococcales cyanobacterium C42_A2020_086]
MVISDLNYLQPVSGEVIGAGYYRKPSVKIYIRQSNDNYTKQYADAYTKFGNAYAKNSNDTYQANVVEF